MTVYENLKTGKKYRKTDKKGIRYGGFVEFLTNGSWYESIVYFTSSLDDPTKFKKLSQ